VGLRSRYGGRQRSLTGRPCGPSPWACRLLFIGLVLLASCAEDPAKPLAEQPDERGWATDQPGLFGFRRSPSGAGKIGEIGYASGSAPAPAATGRMRWSRGQTEDGLNLMCSGDAAEAVLLSMEGKVVHRWALPYADLPGAPPADGPHQLPWRRVRLLDNGDLLAIHSGRALVCVDRDSALRWAVMDRVHHDLDVAPDGSILALSRVERVVPRVNPDEPIVDDLVVRYGPGGERLGAVSLWEAFAASAYADLLDQLTVRTGDVMHANSVDLLDEEEARELAVPGVTAGQVLVCLRDLDLVVAVDLNTARFTWLTGGPIVSRWRAPHDPSVASEGSLLIFDNRGGVGETSRLLRVDPETGAIRWQWTASPPSAFASFFCGTVQQLPAGNLLVAESTQGRAFEIEGSSGDIVWEYVSPRVIGDADELIAALFMAERVPHPAWLQR
jgi:hypothetical protein